MRRNRLKDVSLSFVNCYANICCVNAMIIYMMKPIDLEMMSNLVLS